MANIKCPSCKKETDENLRACSHCGYRLDLDINKRVEKNDHFFKSLENNKCPECGKDVPDGASFCKWCKCNLERKINSNQGYIDRYLSYKTASLYWQYIFCFIAGIFFLILFPFCFFVHWVVALICLFLSLIFFLVGIFCYLFHQENKEYYDYKK